MSDASLTNDPIFPLDGKLRRTFVLFTGDEVPEIDRLAIVMQVIKEMDDLERRAAVSYMADYFGYRVFPK